MQLRESYKGHEGKAFFVNPNDLYKTIEGVSDQEIDDVLEQLYLNDVTIVDSDKMYVNGEKAKQMKAMKVGSEFSYYCASDSYDPLSVSRFKTKASLSRHLR